MLSIQINKNDAIPSYRQLYGGESAVTFALENGNVVISGISTGGIVVGDKIRFKRFNCEGEEVFSDVTIVQGVQADYITVTPFKDMILSTKPRRAFLKENTQHGKWYLIFDIAAEHCYIEKAAGTDCPLDIKENVLGDYSEYNVLQKRCPEDYFLYEETFLYQAPSVTTENKYAFPNSFLNYSEARIKMYNDTVYDLIGVTGNKWKKDIENKCIILENCIIPVNGDGKNNMYSLLWDGAYRTLERGLPDEEGKWDNISTFTIEDERFYKIEDSGLTIKENVVIYLEETDIKLNGVFIEQFDTSLGKQEALQEKFFYEKNEIVDYEKQIFYPVYGNGRTDALSITYNTFFRIRNNDEEWKIIEEGVEHGGETIYWNFQWENVENKGDLAFYLGFDCDDIYYQKKKVSKSFLRILLYDANDRKTQSLLGYSTIFIDTVKLYRNYVKYVNEHPDTSCDDILAATASDLFINFTCSNKYTSDKSSDGFYFYLFPSILGENPEEEKIIYMKTEFNNAKYGRTVPFTMPLDGNKNPTTARTSYETTDTAGRAYVDMTKLFEDTYIKIGISFNKDRNRYEWRFINVSSNKNEIVINLYEPRVNNG